VKKNLQTLYNGSAIPFTQVPRHPLDEFLQTMVDAMARGWRVASYFGIPSEGPVILVCLLTYKSDGQAGVMSTAVEGDRFPSLAASFPQVQLFEREIAEQCGIIPDGHPWFKPVRFHRPFLPGRDAWQRPEGVPLKPGIMDFYRVEGEEVHEVAVGPVHAGIIEPGHFRFQCHGEQVFHLEISLGYQHRAMEQGLIGGPSPRTFQQMETVAGDTTIGHGLAHCMILEALSCLRPPARAEAIRGMALELERLANHTGDLGAIAGDVGYLPTASYCGRIRGDFLNMSALLCGSRFGRGLLCPGGTLFDLTAEQRDDLRRRLDAARRDLTNAVELLWNTPSVMGRLEGTGAVSPETAAELGLVGPAARASGLKRDVRYDYPFGIFRMSQIPVVTGYHGDVCARSMVRWLEAQKSLDFLEEQLRQMPAGGHRAPLGSLAGDTLAIALTEGWRGEVCHVALTDEGGRFRRYKVTDPSFHNWQGLAMALRNEQISDFPLCNKSFNLSYCGFDL
jgi:Ni,Fe-hydrogenase III large subunit/Ni,Fe-hydrogenase III component G